MRLYAVALAVVAAASISSQAAASVFQLDPATTYMISGPFDNAGPIIFGSLSFDASPAGMHSPPGLHPPQDQAG